MRRPIPAVIAATVAAIVSLAAIPLFAQTDAGLRVGTDAFGDWRTDRPGMRRLIRPQDLPAPDLAQSVTKCRSDSAPHRPKANRPKWL